MNDQVELFPVILSGGVGARLWPLSQKDHPKPFLPLPDGQTCLQKTYHRARNLAHVRRILTLTHRDLYALSLEEYRAAQEADQEQESCELKNAATPNPNPTPIDHHFILEPVGRNTAAALLLAAFYYLDHVGAGAVLLALPADHVIEDKGEFAQAVSKAQTMAQTGRVAILGIHPHHADTGFGYIEYEGEEVKRFVEKPSQDVANDYVACGRYVWNAGIICARADVIIAEFESHAPYLVGPVRAAYLRAQKHQEKYQETQQNTYQKAQKNNHDIIKIAAADFAQIPSISIDYAILEKSQKLSVVVAHMGWRDIGSWNAMAELTPADDCGNRVVGDVLVHHTSNCYIHGQEKTVVVLGLRDMIIVDTPDALLIAHKDFAQHLRDVVDHAAGSVAAVQDTDDHQDLMDGS